MSEYCVYLKMPSYLRQWFIHRHGGSNPVNLIRGSIESKLLQRATIPQPEHVLPPRQGEGEVAVCIPYSKSHDPRTYNYITETGKNALIARIKDDWKSRACLTPEGKAMLTPENFFILTPLKS